MCIFFCSSATRNPHQKHLMSNKHSAQRLKYMLRNVSTLPRKRPKGSEVLSAYIKQCKEPPWTSYFIRYKDIEDDQWGKSHFNWKVGNSNYHILRTGCYPYIKYHCTKRSVQDLRIEDNFFRAIKVLNLGNSH